MEQLLKWIKEITGEDINGNDVPAVLFSVLKKINEKYCKLEEDLKKQGDFLAFFKESANAMPNPIFIKDKELKFVFFNQCYREFFGLEENQYIGKSVLDLDYLSEEDRQQYHEEDRAELADQSVVSYEKEFVTADGSTSESLYWSKGFKVPSTGQCGIVGEIVDISNEKKMQRELSRHVKTLNALLKESSESAKTDPGTKLYNKRVLTEDIPAMVEKAKNDGTPLCALMIDLDHFKNVNDTFGHLAGDEVLAKIAGIMNSSFRKSDIAIRYGGDEFAAILSGATKSAAKEIAERFRARVENEVILPDGKSMTVSIGVAELAADEDIIQFMSRADETLYKSKHFGRNRVSVG